MECISRTLDETNRCAEKVLSLLKEAAQNQNNQSAVLTLSGPLGSGKTALTKEIAKLLGVADVVISPTFILRRDYPTTDDTFRSLVHIDAYRFNNQEEATTIHIQEDINAPHTLVVIEWPEYMQTHIPKHALHLTAKAENDTHTFSTVAHNNCAQQTHI